MLWKGGTDFKATKCNLMIYGCARGLGSGRYLVTQQNFNMEQFTHFSACCVRMLGRNNSWEEGFIWLMVSGHFRGSCTAHLCMVLSYSATELTARLVHILVHQEEENLVQNEK